MDERLKLYAKKRREESGGAFELHPATRRMLQDEVARSRSADKRRRAQSGFGWFLALWPRFAVATAILIVLGAGSWALFRPEPTHSAGERMAKFENIEREALAAERDQAMAKDLTSVERRLQRATLRKRAEGIEPEPALTPAPEAPEPAPAPVAPLAQLDLKREADVALGDALSQLNAAGAGGADAGARANSAGGVATESKEAESLAYFGADREPASTTPASALSLAEVGQPISSNWTVKLPASASGGESVASFGRPIESEVPTNARVTLNGFTSLQLANARDEGGAPGRPAEPVALFAGPSLEAGVTNRIDFLKLPPSQSTVRLALKTATTDTPPVASPSPAEFRFEAAEKSKSGPLQRFEQLRTAGRSEGAPPILATFQLERDGDSVRIIDRDGSVYRGQFIAGNDSPAASRAVTGAEAMDGAYRQKLVREEERRLAESLTVNGPEKQGQAIFRAQGTNQSLQQPVVIEAAFITGNATANGVVRAGAELRSPALRIQGRAQIGGGNEIKIDAVERP